MIEIQRIGTDAYVYRVNAKGADAQDAGCTFASLAQCLFDAGASLDHYFPRVEINFEGMFLGACDTEALRSNPKAVAQRIEQHYQPA
ncbi:hypothetical protein [Variovorax sp. GT1P44]|uniref:hypothetical protein n=1 Tax=Variovorax sp. GT1P44 TaxID=3443742 RepID=UPI003F46FB33